MKINDEVIGELERIREENGGLLKPDSVVGEAEDPESPLHGCFNWDDAEAGYQYRLIQAASLIRTVTVHVVPRPDTDLKVRAFVSLPSDRGVGYRRVEEVLADPMHRSELLEMAKRELLAFKNKFKALSELAGVFAEIDRITQHEQAA